MKKAWYSFSLNSSLAKPLGLLRSSDRNLTNAEKNSKWPKRNNKYFSFFSIFRSKSLLLIAALLVLVLIVLLLGLGRRSEVGRSLPGLSSNLNVKKTSQINKAFNFPIRGGNGQAIDQNLKMTMTTIELTKNILIKGKPATARDGKIFLILNLELDNPTNNQLGLAPVELIRLVDPSGKRYAPDVHNDKVTVEAISIKKTRVGFVVDDNQTEWKIQVGEVNGPKETIDVKFI